MTEGTKLHAESGFTATKALQGNARCSGGESCKADFCNEGRVDLWLTKYMLVMEKSTVLKRNYHLHFRGLHTAFLMQTDFSVYVSSLSL